MRLADRHCFHAAARATTVARHRSAAGDCAHAARRIGRDHPYVCPSARCELAFLLALVCRAGTMGVSESMRGWTTAAMDSLVFPRLDVALGKPAWRMAIWHGTTRTLYLCGVRRERAHEGSVCRDRHWTARSSNAPGLVGLGDSYAGESIRLAAARAHLSVSEQWLPDEPYR